MNEDGEPIVEINEPVQIDPPDGVIPEEPPLPTLKNLSSNDKAKRKAEMDRILDALEEEEEQEMRTAKQKFMSKNRSLLDQRRNESEALSKSNEARKKQEKKMGKALLSSLSESSQPPSNQTTPSNKEEAKKKSVTFDDSAKEESTPSYSGKKKTDWGDVLAALPSSSSRRLMQNSLMKADVVERFAPHSAPSSSTPSASRPKAPTRHVEVDSDDEDEGYNLGDGSDSEDSEATIEEGEIDFSDVLHQQEIAAEYYSRRENIMNQPLLTDITQTSSESEERNPWDKEVFPIFRTRIIDAKNS